MAQNSLASAVFHTWRLVDAISASDYNGLSEANQEKVRMIISCGTINMGVNSNIRALLFQLFPEGTDTYDALTALLEYDAPPPP